MHLLPLEFTEESNKKKKKIKKSNKKNSSERCSPAVYSNNLTINYCILLNIQCTTKSRINFKFIAADTVNGLIFSEDYNLYSKKSYKLVDNILDFLTSYAPAVKVSLK